MATTGNAARRTHLQTPGGQQPVSAQPRPADDQAQDTNTMPRQQVEGFTGSGENKALWESRLLAALEVPAASRPLQFDHRNEAQKFITTTIKDKFDVPFFEDLETGWKWENLKREVLEGLRWGGHIKYPSAKELWIRETRAARLAAAEQEANYKEAREAAAAEGYKAGWAEGYKKGKRDGRAAALAQVTAVIQKLRQQGPGHGTQLEASVDKLKFEKTPPTSTDQGWLCAFGGGPGTFAGAVGTSESPKRERGVFSSDSHAPGGPPFPNRLAGHVFPPSQTSASASGPSAPSPFANLSSSTSWMKAATPGSGKTAPTPQKRRLSDSSVESGEVVKTESKSKKVRS